MKLQLSKFRARKGLGGFFFLLLPAVVWPSAAAGMDLNGFLRERGEGDVALSYIGESYDHFWVGESKVDEPALGEVSTQTFSVWTAYGMLPRLAVFANLPHVDVHGDGAADFSDSGFQDVSVVAAYEAAAWDWAPGGTRSELVVGGGIRTPLSDYEANAPVSLGDGTTDVLLRVVHLLSRGSFYWSQQLGYDARGGEAPDGWPLFTELGWNRGRATLSLYYSSLIVSGGTDIGEPGFTFPGNREEFQRVGGKAYFQANDRYGVTVGGFATVDGRNTGDSSGVWAGVVAHF